MQDDSAPVKSHFSLIELLVVIAILAVLAGLLLPAMNKARDIAKESLCSGNLKQITMAMIAYSMDYNDFSPGSDMVLTVNFSPNNWMDSFARLYKLRKDPAGCSMASSTLRQTSNLFRCPAHKDEDFFSDPYGPRTSYGINYFGLFEYERPKLTSFQFPSRAFYLGDTSGDSKHLLHNETVNTSSPRFDHNGKCAYSFIDGHIELRKVARVPWRYVHKQWSSILYGHYFIVRVPRELTLASRF